MVLKNVQPNVNGKVVVTTIYMVTDSSFPLVGIFEEQENEEDTATIN